MEEPFDWNRYANKEMSELIPLEAWAQDFVSELFNRNLFFRLLFRIAVGRHAYREFAGLVKTLDGRGHYLRYGSGGHDCDYHNEKQPFDYGNFKLSR